jgi:uncharacterized protein YegJ (DUF2314 family)
MLTTTGCLILLALAGCSSESPDVARDGEPLVTSFSDEDREMNAAMTQARETLPEFERRLKNPPASQSHIALKARFDENGEVEHMWINDVELVEDGFRGVLGNEPVHVTSIKFEDPVTIGRDRVSDWMAIDDDTLVGGYTLRVQRARMPDEQRKEFDASVGFRIED